MANTGLTAYQQASIQLQQQRLAMQQQQAALAQQQKEAQSQSMTPYQQAQVALAQQRQMGSSSTNPILEALNQATALQYTPAESPIYSTGVQMLQQAPQWNGRSETPMRDYLLQALTLKGIGSLMQGFGEDRISQELRPQYTQVLQALDPTSQYLPDIQADSFDPKTFQWKLVDALQNNERQKKLQDTLANALAQRGAATGEFGLTMGEDGILSIAANPEGASGLDEGLELPDGTVMPPFSYFQKLAGGNEITARQLQRQYQLRQWGSSDAATFNSMSATMKAQTATALASPEKVVPIIESLKLAAANPNSNDRVSWNVMKVIPGTDANAAAARVKLWAMELLKSLKPGQASDQEQGWVNEIAAGNGLLWEPSLLAERVQSIANDIARNAQANLNTYRAVSQGKYPTTEPASAKARQAEVEALQTPTQGSSSQQIPPGYKLQRNKKTGETRLVPQ